MEQTGRGLRASVDGRVVDVRDGSVMGRRDDAAVRIDDPLVSRSHAALRHSDGGWLLEDLGSSNGTFVDGARVDRVVIGRRTVVRLGDPDSGPEVVLEPVGVDAAPRTIRIGRAPDNDLVIDDLLVSRHHAEVRLDGSGGGQVVDEGSHNGTFVNGQLVFRAPVRDLDVIGIGHHQLRLVGGRLEEYVDTGEISFEALDLTVHLDDGRVLLDHVTFALESSTFLAVVGPSGSGKSTLLNALTGFKPADEGVVLYDGRDLYAEYEELRSRIGLVPQSDVVHTELTVRRALEFAAALRFPPDVSREQRRARVDEVLVELGLAERADVVIEQLSGGQRKRVSVAYELLTRPSLLLLDEPTSGLDPGYERSLMLSLRALADDGRTVIVVTHSIASIELCDRVLFLAPGGRTAYFGPPGDAAAFFHRDGLEEVFQDLGADADRDWTGEFALTAEHRRYVAEPVALAERPRTSTPVVRSARALGWRRWWRQFTTLCRRYLAVIASDRRTLALLVLQAPFLGLLMLWRLPSGELGPPPEDTLRVLSSASIVIFNLVIGATWIGMSSAAREIVKELPQFRRERAAGLSLSAYLGSKVVVLGAITLAQIVVYTLIATAAQHGPEDAVALGSGRVELALDVAVAALAGMCLGLLISALARTSEQAMIALPVVLIAQMVLASGAVFPDAADRFGLQQAKEVVSAQWGFSAAAATADLNRIQAFNNRVRDIKEIDLDQPEAIIEKLARPATGPTRWAHRVGPWLTDLAVMVALSIAALIATGLILSRRDPGPAP
jgi:ABC-type multidrug transport system ATPase subunit/pSer/pThr/pTyr-binding forkhead associated (FHA) protein